MTRPVVLSLAAVLVLVSTVDAQSRRRVASQRAHPLATPVTVSDDFRNGSLGWEAGFSDYSTYTTLDTFEFASGVESLPSEVGEGTAFMISSHNRSDDVFMFLKKKLTPTDGIVPGGRYTASFQLRLASNAGGPNCGGIGGAPGYSVFLKVGASGSEPRVVLDERGTYYKITIDKGSQAQSGTAASVAGHISNESEFCSGTARYMTIERTHTHPHVVTANSFGELWLIVGTDSGFEGKTTLYYQSVGVTLTPAE